MTDRPTLFLTGAAGVIGAALLPTLRQYRVITLVHRALPAGGEHLRGDLGLPRFGLGQRAFDGLCQEVDAVVHCGAVTDFSQHAERTLQVNVAGTRNVLELCSAAQAPLLQVSSAFVERRHRSQPPLRAGEVTPSAYLVSKDRAEQLIKTSGVPHFIARPSVVIGDSITGEIARFQGFHAFATGLLRGHVPFVPGHLDTQLDFVPQDLVASSLIALLAHGLRSGFDDGEYWLTSGPESLTLARILELVRDAGAFADLEVTLPRVMPHEAVERLIRPAFMDLVPRGVRRRIDEMLALALLFVQAPSFPSSLGAYPGSPPRPATAELEGALSASLHYLLRAKSLGIHGKRYRLAQPSDSRSES